jgi:UPF0716 protein FxsA
VALLVALFIVVPIVELWLIIQIGGLIGVVPTLALLLADAVLGSLLLRHQGRGAWRRFNQAIAERRFPAREVADGLMIAVGGTLLLTPGFITDVVGLLLLIPPTRAIARRTLRGVFMRRFTVVGMSSLGGMRRSSPGPDKPAGERQAPAASRPYDFDGTAEELDADDPELPR